MFPKEGASGNLRRLFVDVAGALFVPNTRMQRFRLILQQGADDLSRALPAFEHLSTGQIERRILRVIAGDGTKAMFAQPVDYAANASPIDCARAHGAGLGG